MARSSVLMAILFCCRETKPKFFPFCMNFPWPLVGHPLSVVC